MMVFLWNERLVIFFAIVMMMRITPQGYPKLKVQLIKILLF